jgi:hypothetical protein
MSEREEYVTTLERDCHVLRLRAENAEAALLAAELRAKRELAEARVDLTNCADVGRRLEIELRRAVAEAAEADTTRREWEVRAAESYAAGRAAGLREAAGVCHAIKQENGDDPRVWLVDYMEECEQRILALAPPAAETVNHTITATSFDGRKASPYACDALPAAETVVPRG